MLKEYLCLSLLESYIIFLYKLFKMNTIKEKIKYYRNTHILLDSDLAILYGIETKRLKEAVKRNRERFPEDFLFELTKEELLSLRSQFASSNLRGGNRYQSYAFTELGVAMLSSIINTPRAIQINITIMRTFVAVRKYYNDFEEINGKIKILETTYNQRFDEICDAINQLISAKKEEMEWQNRNRIGYKP